MIAAFAGHVPVLLRPVLDLLGGGGRRTLLDCTVGLGGHADAWLREDAEARVVALDRDPEMLARARERLTAHGDRARFLESSYADARETLEAAGETGPFDAALLDAGVASPHLDEAERGFGLGADGPLDMRFDRAGGPTAEDLVRTLPEAELARILFEFGEERRSRAVARAIVEARRLGPIRTTLHLADIVARVTGGGRVHPATRTFQALRIAVNDELEHLRRGVESLPDLLAPEGRIGVIAFHSLEDRIVKTTFREAAREGRLEIVTRRPVTPDADETRANARSRSARLRVAARPAREPERSDR